MPASAACFAAQSRFFEVGRPQRRRGVLPAGTRPAMTCTRGQARAAAYSRARSKPLRNSSSRPGRLAMPRSPLAKSPGGALNSTWLQAGLLAASRPAWRPATRRGRGTRPPRSRRPRPRRSDRGTVLGVHHAQVGGEARHRDLLVRCSPAGAELAAQLVDLRRRQRRRLRLAAEPEARGLLAAPRAPPSPPPASRARRSARAATASPRGSARRAARPWRDRRGDLIADARARPAAGRRSAARGRPSSRSTA